MITISFHIKVFIFDVQQVKTGDLYFVDDLVGVENSLPEQVSWYLPRRLPRITCFQEQVDWGPRLILALLAQLSGLNTKDRNREICLQRVDRTICVLMYGKHAFFFGKYPYKITSLAVFFQNRVEIWRSCQPATPRYFPTARTGFGADSSLEEATELGGEKIKRVNCPRQIWKDAELWNLLWRFPLCEAKRHLNSQISWHYVGNNLG